MYLLYECKAFSFKYTSGKINLWKSTGVNNYSRDSDMDAVSVATTSLPPLIDNKQMSVRLEGAYFKQMRLLRPNNDSIVKMLQILQNINMKDMEYALMEVVHLVKEELTMVETF